jgi:hypothetical protein
MARSYRTRPPGITARQRARRDETGEIVLPRIVVRRPRPGDIHHLTKPLIIAVLRAVPEEYLYGLKMIELRPRVSKYVGTPHGYYARSSQEIVIYSAPAREWAVSSHQVRWVFGFQDWDIDVRRCKGRRIVAFWDSPRQLAYFYASVLFHELGHHHADMYRTRRRYPRYRTTNENLAELHKIKLMHLTDPKLMRVFDDLSDRVPDA